MHESTIAKRYANALSALAVEQEIVDRVGQELNRFKELLDGVPGLRALLASPTTSRGDQMAALRLCLEQMETTAITGNFLRLLVDKRRMALIDDMVAAYNREVERRGGVERVAVRSAGPLSEEQLQNLDAALRELTRKEVALDVEEDPALLGGLVVRIGSTMMDYSVRGQLNRLKAYMKG